MSLLSGFYSKVSKHKDFSSPSDPKGTVYKHVEKRTVHNGDLIRDIGFRVDEQTASIEEIKPNSLADKAGLMKGFYIFDINGEQIVTGADVAAAFAKPCMGIDIKLFPREGVERLIKIYSDAPATSDEKCLALDIATYLSKEPILYGFLRESHPIHSRWAARFEQLRDIKQTLMVMLQEREAKAVSDLLKAAEDDSLFAAMEAEASGAANQTSKPPPVSVGGGGIRTDASAGAEVKSATLVSHTVGNILETVEAADLFSGIAAKGGDGDEAGGDSNNVIHVDMSTFNSNPQKKSESGDADATFAAPGNSLDLDASSAQLLALLQQSVLPVPTSSASPSTAAPEDENAQLLFLLQQHEAASESHLAVSTNEKALHTTEAILPSPPTANTTFSPVLPTPAADNVHDAKSVISSNNEEKLNIADASSMSNNKATSSSHGGLHENSTSTNPAATSANTPSLNNTNTAATTNTHVGLEATYTLSDGRVVRTSVYPRSGPKPPPPSSHEDPATAIAEWRISLRKQKQREKDERRRIASGGVLGKNSRRHDQKGGDDQRKAADGSSRPCRDWLAGSCNRKSCKYRHDEKDFTDRNKRVDTRGGGGGGGGARRDGAAGKRDRSPDDRDHRTRGNKRERSRSRDGPNTNNNNKNNNNGKQNYGRRTEDNNNNNNKNNNNNGKKQGGVGRGPHQNYNGHTNGNGARPAPAAAEQRNNRRL